MAKESSALVKAEPAGALVLPEYVKAGDTRGHEGIEQNDLILPRLAVAQPTSPELVRGEPKYIAGLQAGDLFNTVTRESYGQGPVRVVIVRREKPRAVEFAPMAEGGGIRDMNVPLTDPRCQFGANGERPAATEFREYIAVLADTLEPIALSFKGTSLKSAKMLNTLLEMPFKGKSIPYFARVFAITASLKSNEKGKFYVFGAVQDGFASPDAFQFAEGTYENLKGQKLAVDAEVVHPDAEGAEKEDF